MKKRQFPICLKSIPMRFLGITFLLLTGMFTGKSYAQAVIQGSILKFDFSSATGSEATYASSYNNTTYVNSSTISKGAGLQAPANATTGGNFLTAGYFVATNWTGSTEALAITNNSYFEFTLTPVSGNEFRIDTITIRWRSATSGVSGVSIRSSLDNYATTKATGIVSAASSGVLYLVLTSPITSSSSVTIRMYGWGASGGKNFGIGENPTNTSNPDIDVRGQLTSTLIQSAVLSNAGGNSTICLGAGAHIKIVPSGGTPPFTVWTKDNLGLLRTFTQNSASDSIQVFPQETKTYTLDSVKDAMGDKVVSVSGSATITVTSSPVVSNVGTYARTLTHNDGLTLTYADGSLCKSWIKIADALGGTNPGSTTCTANVLNATPVNGTSRYFLPRHVTVTPTTNGNATLTLFYSQAEFTLFNNSSLYQQRFPTGPSDTSGILNKVRVFRTQNSTETDSLTSFAPTSIAWNSANSQWEIAFQVNDAVLGGNYYATTLFPHSLSAGPVSHTAATPQVGQTSASVTINWPDVVGATAYRLRFRPQGGSWNASTVSASERTYNYLSFNTTYECQVRVVTADGQGEYTKTYTFTTPQDPGKLPNCNAPTSVSKTVQSPTSVQLKWTPISNAQTYVVQMRVKNNLVWGGTSTNDTAVVFTSLSPNTTYEFRIRTQCNPGTTDNGSSDFSSVDTFRTPNYGPCATVTNLSNHAITATSSTIKWSPANGATAYQVEMRVKNAATWGGSSTSDTSYTFNNLSPSTTYEYRIRTLCNNPALASTSSSTFTSIAEFTTSAQTLGNCLPPTNIQTTPGTNSVLVTWDTAQYGIQYFVNLKTPAATTWGGTTVSTNSRTFSNLSPATQYMVRIRTVCAPGTTFTANSAFSDIVYVTTTSLPNKMQTDQDYNTIHVFPNPVLNQLQIALNATKEETLTISLLDMTGKQVNLSKVSTLIGRNQWELPVEGLSTGVYTLQIRSEQNMVFMGKIIKQ